MTCLFSPSASVFLFLFSVFCSLLKNTPVCISRSVLFGLCAASCSSVWACVCVCVCVSVLDKHTQPCPTLCNPMAYSLARFLCPWDFPRQEYWSRFSFHFIFRGIFPTYGSNSCFLHLLLCSHWGSPWSICIVYLF